MRPVRGRDCRARLSLRTGLRRALTQVNPPASHACPSRIITSLTVIPTAWGWMISSGRTTVILPAGSSAASGSGDLPVACS